MNGIQTSEMPKNGMFGANTHPAKNYFWINFAGMGKNEKSAILFFISRNGTKWERAGEVRNGKKWKVWERM